MKPKIIFVNRVYPPLHGATGRVLRDLAKAFVRDGWDVRVIASGDLHGGERDGAIAVSRVKGAVKPKDILGYVVTWLRLFFAALSLPKAKKGEPQPVIVTMTDPPMLPVIGRMVQRLKGYRHIHWCQDLYPDLFPIINVKFPGFVQKILHGFVYRAIGAADKVIVIGRCMARYLTDQGIEKSRVSVIPNWPDREILKGKAGALPIDKMDEMPEAMRSGVRDRDEQLKDTPKFRVLYAGNIGRAHPIDTILQAAEVLNKDHPEIEFVFVGDGPEFEKVSKLRSLKHLDTIRLLPYQPAHRLRALMESGDVHLVAMKNAALGMLVPSKFYGSIAAARPSILLGPRESEIGRIIEDYNCGQIVRDDDVRGLIEAVRYYRTNPDAWFDAQKAAAKAGQVFVPKASTHAWVKRVREVCGFVDKAKDKPVKKAA